MIFSVPGQMKMKMMASTSLAIWYHTAHLTFMSKCTCHFYSGFTEFNASNRVNRYEDRVRQVCGAEAVDTGICALVTRVQYNITEKMSVFLDEMEYDAGLRSVVGVQECLITRQANLQQNTKKPKSIQSSQFVGCGSQSHFNTRNHFEMRQKICRGNAFVRCEGPVQTIGCTPRKGRRW
jgi:hypothetical protein